MAIYHFDVKPVQRSKGHSAVAKAAERSGTRLYGWRTMQAHNFCRKHRVVLSAILAPSHAPEWVYDREELWNRAEAAETRRNAQPAREIRLGLPHELTDEQRARLVLTYARDIFVSAGMVADISIHPPAPRGNARNHYACILLTMRELDGGRFARTKQRAWGRRHTLMYWREQWAHYQNRALEAAGSDARVDHRTLEAQGIRRRATEHLGKAATDMERKGKRTERGDLNREIAAGNRTLEPLVQALETIDEEIAVLSKA
ncbi:MAG TPA: MobQ family relaxase [Ktedonobacteraceae bacterium]|nr:MobQ family relaxase [Ktedonobacteraceae bacterium]